MATTGPKGAAPTQAERAEPTDTRLAAMLGGPGSMDKVRDILFGAQMREFEKRLLRMEEKLGQDQSDFREDARRRFEAIEQFLRSEVETLSARIKEERSERLESARGIEKSILDGLKAAERKLTQLDEQVGKLQRELRQQQHEQVNGLRDELRAVREQLSASLSRQVDDIRHDKLDRAALASLLSEVALRLSGEPSVSDPR